MKICIAGKNSIAIFGIKKIIALYGKESLLVCPNKSDSGESSWQPSVRRFIREFDIQEITLERCYQVSDLIFISLEFDRIINPSLFCSEKLYNIHFSKLPKYKGMYTSAWPILNAETESGVTLHKIDNGIDTGDIIDQIVFDITEKDNARDLYLKYLTHAETLLNANLTNLVDNNYISYPQSPLKSTYYSKKSINYKNINIDINQTATSIRNQIRAYNFREFQIPSINQTKISHAEISNQRSRQKPGEIIEITSTRTVISTIDYDLVCHHDFTLDIFDLIKNEDKKGLEKCIQKGVDLNVTNKYGWTPLIVACFEGKKDIVKQLILNKASVHKTNQNGTTPLMYAKENLLITKKFDICEILIKAGASTTQKDFFQKNLAYYLKKNGRNEILDRLTSLEKSILTKAN